MNMYKIINDIYPVKAQFQSNEHVELVVELVNTINEDLDFNVVVIVRYLNSIIKSFEYDIKLMCNQEKKLALIMEPLLEDFKGYGVDAYIFNKGRLLDVFSGAFDVVSDWRKTTRYGFLSDFYTTDEGDCTDVQSLNKLHITLVQFYDWMYRCDTLVSPSNEFVDLMGRKLNQKVVKEKIGYCHGYGMKAIAYGAVYASSYDFFKDRKDWALYTSDGNPFCFINKFYIMNIAKESPWHDHIIGQYSNVIEKMDFDGIHMDTYGYPKIGISKLNNVDKVERLEEHFPVLIDDTRVQLEKVKEELCLIFNNVGNWPVESVATANQDAVYIEVWSPYERYHHLQQLISYAKIYGNGKPVILAAYSKAFLNIEDECIAEAESSLLLLSAVIASNGAYHLVLGEKNGILTQGYYVDYYRCSDAFFRILRNYNDFSVRYENLLYGDQFKDVSMTHVHVENMEYVFENFQSSTYGESGKVWTVIRESALFKTISLINLVACKDDYWCSKKCKPEIISNLVVKIQIECEVKSVFFSTPDFDMGRPDALEYRIEHGTRGKILTISIERLELWGLLVVELQ